MDEELPPLRNFILPVNQCFHYSGEVNLFLAYISLVWRFRKQLSTCRSCMCKKSRKKSRISGREWRL